MGLPGQRALKLLLGKSREQAWIVLLLMMQLDQSWGHLEADVHRAQWKARRGTTQHLQSERGTWEVVNQGKPEMVKRGKERLNIAVLGVHELKWTGVRHFSSGSYKVFHSGIDKQKRNEVALILRQAIRGYNAISDRFISVILLGKHINITIIQVYAPNT